MAPGGTAAGGAVKTGGGGPKISVQGGLPPKPPAVKSSENRVFNDIGKYASGGVNLPGTAGQLADVTGYDPLGLFGGGSTYSSKAAKRAFDPLGVVTSDKKPPLPANIDLQAGTVDVGDGRERLSEEMTAYLRGTGPRPKKTDRNRKILKQIDSMLESGWKFRG
jgi:hypothetical protein